MPEPEKDREALYYFDRKSIKPSSSGDFLVQDKIVSTDAKGYLLRLFEIDCTKKTSKTLKWMIYDDMDKEIKPNKPLPPQDPINIDDDARYPMYHLYKICCQGKK
jgi:hypothetical protein